MVCPVSNSPRPGTAPWRAVILRRTRSSACSLVSPPRCSRDADAVFELGSQPVDIARGPFGERGVGLGDAGSHWHQPASQALRRRRPPALGATGTRVVERRGAAATGPFRRQGAAHDRSTLGVVVVRVAAERDRLLVAVTEYAVAIEHDLAAVVDDAPVAPSRRRYALAVHLDPFPADHDHLLPLPEPVLPLELDPRRVGRADHRRATSGERCVGRRVRRLLETASARTGARRSPAALLDDVCQLVAEQEQAGLGVRGVAVLGEHEMFAARVGIGAQPGGRHLSVEGRVHADVGEVVAEPGLHQGPHARAERLPGGPEHPPHRGRSAIECVGLRPSRRRCRSVRRQHLGDGAVAGCALEEQCFRHARLDRVAAGRHALFVDVVDGGRRRSRHADDFTAEGRVRASVRPSGHPASACRAGRTRGGWRAAHEPSIPTSLPRPRRSSRPSRCS